MTDKEWAIDLQKSAATHHRGSLRYILEHPVVAIEYQLDRAWVHLAMREMLDDD